MPTARSEHAARDAYLNLVRLHEQLSGQFGALFRAHGLSQAQYNALRILVGAPREGASCQYVGERLLNRVPDVTRLIDRLEAAGLVERHRSTEDRRVVLVTVTPEGRRLCRKLDRPVLDLHARQFAHLSERELATLDRTLRKALDAPPA